MLHLYIDLIKIYIKDDITSDDVMKAIELFQKNNFDSPDILDIMSCIFLKSKDYNNAKKYSEYAIKSLVSNNGYLQKNSEILNNDNRNQISLLILNDHRLAFKVRFFFGIFIRFS